MGGEGETTAAQFEYRNPYRRHSAIGLPSSHLFPDTEYEDEYVQMEASNQRRERPSDNLGNLQGLNFAARTEASEYSEFRPVSHGQSEYNNNRRREGEWPGGGAEFSTENKENFGRKATVKLVRARAYSNIGLHEDRLESKTETRAQYGRRAVTTGQVSLDSESFSWSGDTETGSGRGQSSRPKTRQRRGSGAGGLFALKSETSARYGRRAGLTDKPDKFTMRDNIKTPGPDAKFYAYSAQREQFRQHPVPQRVKYKPKSNIKTFDDNHLHVLEQEILRNKEKKRSISLNSLRDDHAEISGEDEILYQANNYTNT